MPLLTLITYGNIVLIIGWVKRLFRFDTFCGENPLWFFLDCWIDYIDGRYIVGINLFTLMLG